MSSSSPSSGDREEMSAYERLRHSVSVNSEANSRRIALVESCFGSAGQPLSVPGRVLVGEGVLTKACRKKLKPRQFFLFNDLLVYGNIIINKKKYNKQHIIPLEDIKLQSLEDEGQFRNGWLICTRGKSFAVYAATATEKQEWMAHIDKCIRDLLAKSGKKASSEHAAVWVPDAEAPSCMICKKTQFSLVQRRHHCRKCGAVACGACSSQKFVLPGQSSKPLRVCTVCHEELSKGKQEQQHRTLQEVSRSSPAVAATTPAPPPAPAPRKKKLTLTLKDKQRAVVEKSPEVTERPIAKSADRQEDAAASAVEPKSPPPPRPPPPKILATEASKEEDKATEVEAATEEAEAGFEMPKRNPKLYQLMTMASQENSSSFWWDSVDAREVKDEGEEAMGGLVMDGFGNLSFDDDVSVRVVRDDEDELESKSTDSSGSDSDSDNDEDSNGNSGGGGASSSSSGPQGDIENSNPNFYENFDGTPAAAASSSSSSAHH